MMRIMPTASAPVFSLAPTPRKGSLRAVLLCMAGLTLAGCAETQFATQSAKSLSGSAEWGKVGAYKVGNPYQIDGRWYYPREDWEYSEEGVASWYGPGFHGKDTANGEAFDQNALTAAHRTLPMPSLVRVTNLKNGRALVLRVNDRGPFANDRILDVSRRSAQLLGFSEQGTTRVRVEILPDESQALKQEALGVQTGTPVQTAGAPNVVPAPRGKVVASSESLDAPAGTHSSTSTVATSALPPPSAAVPQTRKAVATPVQTTAKTTPVSAAVSGTYVQAAAFSTRASAEALRTKLASVHAAVISPVTVNGRELYRVRLGPLHNSSEAERVLGAVRSHGLNDARVVTD